MGLLETGRFPVSFYRGWMRAVPTVIVPVAFMTTFPARALPVCLALLCRGEQLNFAVSEFHWQFFADKEKQE